MLSTHTASIACNAKGEVCISFDDLAFARADTIFIDYSSNEISALVDGLHVKLGTIPAEMASGLAGQSSVLLRAPHPQGHELHLFAALQSIH